MPGPELERARQLLQQGNLSPEKRSRLEAAVRSYEEKAAAGGGPGGVPLRQAGESAPDVDPYELDVKAAEAALQPAEQERLPTAYRPLNERAVAAPIMYQEPMSGDADEGWRGAMSQADKEGRPAYRVRDEFPLSLDPSTWTPETLAVRAALAGGAFGRGFDNSATLGAGSKGLANAYGIAGADQSLDEMSAANPALHIAGRVGGALPGRGAAGMIGQTANKMVGLGRGGGVLSNLLRAGAGGAMAGATQAGGEAAVAGQDVDTAVQGGGGVGALLGPLAYGLSRFGAGQQRSLRDPETEMGRDLARAEAAGAKTNLGWNAVKGSPAMQELAEEGRAAGGYSPEAMAVEKAVPLLGRELDAAQKSMLGSIRAQNEQLGQSPATTSLQPVLTKGLETLRKATYSQGGGLLPGVNPRGVADVVKRSGTARIVSRTDPAVEAAGENVMDVGLARKLGIVSRASSATDGDSIVILEPNNATVSELDTMTRALDDQANVGAGIDVAKRRPIKALGAAAREARAGLGPEVEAAKAAQSRQLNDMGNAFEAAGLPRRSEGVDLADVGTRNALAGGVRRFRTDANRPNDVELERVAANNPELRDAMNLAAGTGAAGRLRARSDIKAAIGTGGITGLPAAAFTGMRLRLDPVMGALGAMPAGIVPATSTELARRFRGR